jgi:N-acetylmuramoyl-L-alanine amidase
VLQFPEQPRYRVEDRPGGVDVHFTDADLVAQGTGWGTVRDPLVRRVAVAGERVHIDLGPGVQTATYTLERPFRLVFDLHRPTTTVPAPPVESLGGHGAREKGIRTIVLDPGHGGGETGAIGPSGTLEKDLTLALARALKHKLESQMPVKVVLTRDEDAPLPLETRTAVANQNQADLFLSIHLNSAAGSGARGAETYFLSLTASDARAEQSAQAENRPAEGDLASYDLQLILWDLAQSRHLAESQTVARLIQEELNQALGLRDRGVKQAPFRVLMGAAMPAVLVELGFLSNPEEESRLADAAYRAGLVDALARAVARYRAQVAPRPDGSGESARGGPAEAGGVPAP